MKYLITGGAGFIGSHLAERLREGGHEVVVYDDLSTGAHENIAALERGPGFRFVKDSVLNADLVEEFVRESDGVFHLASSVGVELVMREPVRTIENILLGAHAVLKAAARFRKRVLITSTSEVYGKSKDVPFDEEGDRLEGPTSKHRWAYAAAKAMDEFLALAHWKESKLPVVVTRLFNTVGPRQSGRYGMVVPRFVQAALANEPLQVYGDGGQSRCFCHVDDVVDGLTGLFEAEGAAGRVFNIGSAEEVTIKDLAARIVTRLGSRSEVRSVPYEQAYGAGFEDMRRRAPSTERVRGLIGWRPRRDLDRIIDDVAAWSRKRQGEPRL